MNSTILTGVVSHQRKEPRVHKFEYPVYFYCLDLAELDTLDAGIAAFGYNRRRPVMIRDGDYLEPGDVRIEDKVRAHWKAAGCEAEIGQILMVTSARFLGYVFNPVSFYLGYDKDGTLQCALAEVNNTFGDRHLYVIPAVQRDGDAWVGRARQKKAFHVSPFNDMDGVYDFYFSVQPSQIDIRVDMEKEGRRVFLSRLTGKGQSLSARSMGKVICRMPLTAMMITPRIIAQAMRLKWLRRLPVYTRPEPESDHTIIRRRPGWFDRMAKRLVLSLLGRIRHGRLEVQMPGGERHVFGEPDVRATQTIHVRRYDFFRRLVSGGDIGFGEAFTAGDFFCDDPAAVLELLIANRDALGDGGGMMTLLSKVRDTLRHIARSNTITNSRKNIFEHYDLGNDFFKEFLDSSMTYSSAIFTRPDESLRDAQFNKLRAIIRKARITPDHHVLEVGSGWGSCAIETVMQTGCRVTTVTVSEEQRRLAQERVKAAGLEDRITVKLCDYRMIDGTYDRIISIEMIEAVGHRYLPAYFRTLDRLLAPGGLIVLQVITIPEHRYDAYRRGCDWIQKHIFPGGHLPSLDAMTRAMLKARTAFYVEDLDNIGLDYARTLRLWRDRFTAHWDSIRQQGFDDDFMRKWVYYLAYCEAAFSTRTLNTLQLVISRPNNPSLIAERPVPDGIVRS